MSAYALPGSFFFPTTPSAESSNSVKHGNKSNTIEPSGSKDLKDMVNALPSTKHNSGGAGDKEPWFHPSDLFISIKSGSIDPIRLIQGFTARRPSRFRRKIGEKMATLSSSLTGVGFSLSTSITDVDEQWGEYSDEYSNDNDNSPPSSPKRHDVQFRCDELDSSSHSSATDVSIDEFDDDADAHNEAIQFTLSISFNGRKYTATRALPLFVKLRDDLVLELSRSKKTSVRFNTSGFPRSHRNGEFSNASDHEIFHECREKVEEVIIPELPIGGDKPNGDKAGGLVGMANRGFRGMQETVCSYCPPMESWIQSVAALVPLSPTLANFLWEPIHQGNEARAECLRPPPVKAASKISGYGSRTSLSMRNGSFTALNAIDESAHSDTDDGDS